MANQNQHQASLKRLYWVQGKEGFLGEKSSKSLNSKAWEGNVIWTWKTASFGTAEEKDQR